ncbi:MAG: Rieske (2Fe-2S) protein [Phycisphaerales bacterium]|nr:Rieske (2Fe-2S) protein [Phycisphaerales bacterium]
MTGSDSVRDAPQWTRLIEVDRCPLGKGVFVEIAGRELGVFRRDDAPRFTVMDNSCPHASGNLSGGEVAGGTVSCPWHHWTFDLETGICTHSPLARVKVYACRVSEGVLYADLAS